MSVRALTWSFNLRLDDMAAKAALHALADHADEDGKCWPSIGRIARWMGCHEKTARRAVHRIVELGAVLREPRSGTSDIYVLQLDWQPEDEGRPKRKDIPVALRIKVYLRDGHKCRSCGCADVDALSLDHIIPLAKGGTDDFDNLQTLCGDCNRAKSDSEPLPELEGQEGEGDKSGVVAKPKQYSPSSAQTPPQRGSRTFKNRKLIISAASASASPDGPPRPLLPDTAKWVERLANHRPLEGKPCWTNAWGLSPDSAGRNGLIPPNLYREWRQKYDADMAAFKAGRAA